MARQLLAVYGSLRKGQINHGVMRGAGFLFKTRVRGFAMYDVGEYPVIVAGRGSAVVEVYAANPSVEARVAALESEDGYVPRIVRVRGRSAILWMRLRAPRRARKVKSGDWSAYLASRQR